MEKIQNDDMEYFCPNCCASISKQRGFSPELKTWECAHCGQKLYDNEADAEEVTWYCDDCHAKLNKQEGFSDKLDSWICKVCGYKNPLTSEHIYDSVFDYEDNLRYDEKQNMFIPLPNTEHSDE